MTENNADPLVKKRLLIHAGVHQCGAALMQERLSNSAGRLAAQGVLYPAYEPSAQGGARSHQRLAWDILGRKFDPEALRDWANSLAAADAGTIVLSAEDFCRIQDLSCLKVFVELFAVEVVLYLRRQDDWINSWYNLNVRWPYDGRFSRCNPVEFLEYLPEFHWIRYFDLVERWALLVGPTAVHVRVLEQGQVDDPVADLCSLIGIDRDVVAAGPPADGRRQEWDACLPADQIEILYRLGSIEYPGNVRQKIVAALGRLGGSAGNNVYRPELRRLIVARYHLQNQKLARKFLGRADGDLFRVSAYPAGAHNSGKGPDEQRVIAFIRNLIDELFPGHERG